MTDNEQRARAEDMLTNLFVRAALMDHDKAEALASAVLFELGEQRAQNGDRSYAAPLFSLIEGLPHDW